MELFAAMGAQGFGELHARRDAATGLRAIVAIHDTRLGPALGGCRMITYADEASAVIDALRLARGMTYKAAVARLPHGGGKSVIMLPAGEFDRRALFQSFGRFVDALAGRYITAEDSGTTPDDMEAIRTQTRYVTGVDPARGGAGDPSPHTAFGVRRGIEACVKFQLGRDSLAGVSVAVQGIGHVGYYLCRELAAAGAKVTVADLDPARAERARAEFGARVVPIESIFDVEADVLAPCALGSALNDDSIPRLRVGIIAGAANNQLAEPRHGEQLHRRGIVYAPDYAINAGGLIHVAQEYAGYDADIVRARATAIYDTIFEIVRRAKSDGVPSNVVADQMAEEILGQASSR